MSGYRWWALVGCVLVSLGLGARFYCSDQVSSIVGPNKLVVMDSGAVIVIAGDALWLHDSSGGAVSKVPMASLGSESYIGPAAQAGDNAIFLRNDATMDDSLKQKLAAYRRQEMPSLDDVSAGPPVIQQCDLSTLQCTDVGDERAVHSRRVFAIERVGDSVIVADTLSGELIGLGTSGDMEWFSGKLFHFPNDLSALDNERFLIADTNHHRIVRGLVDQEGLRLEDDLIVVRREDFGDYVWPVSVASSRDFIAVVQSNTALSHDRIYLYSMHGDLQREMVLPTTGDPLDVEFHAGRWLVADFKGMTVHAFGEEGAYQGEFGAPEFLAAMAGKRDQRKMMLAGSWTGLVGAVLGLGCLLVAWWMRQT